jgi:hypothetical protein
MNCELVVESFEIDFDYFVDQLLNISNFIENGLEQFALDFRRHPIRAVDADQAGMKRNISKFPTCAWIIRGSAKIDAVPRHKGPVSFQDEALQFPVLLSRFAHPNRVGTFPEAATLGDRNQIQTQALINQEFHCAIISLLRRCVVVFS